MVVYFSNTPIILFVSFLLFSCLLRALTEISAVKHLECRGSGAFWSAVCRSCRENWDVATQSARLCQR